MKPQRDWVKSHNQYWSNHNHLFLNHPTPRVSTESMSNPDYRVRPSASDTLDALILVLAFIAALAIIVWAIANGNVFDCLK